MTTETSRPLPVLSSEGLGLLVESTGLLECIDDAYQARGDWKPIVAAFAGAVQAAERRRFAALCRAAQPAGGRQWDEAHVACFEALEHVAMVVSGPNVRAKASSANYFYKFSPTR